MEIMDGKKYRDELLDNYKRVITENKYDIRLDIIFVGDNDASRVYVRNKVKYCEEVGIKVVVHNLGGETSENELISLIDELNNNKEVTGIILQSPIPAHLDFKKCAEIINYKKDVDGFTNHNIDSLYHNEEAILPCTVKGIIKLLEHYDIKIEGANIVVIGRGEIVGKPLALALENRNATVTLCHSKTKDLSHFTKDADIIISAIGKAKMITSDMVSDGFIGVDVGINRDEDNKLCGDFDYESINYKAKYITPVPGGVGPMTIAMLIGNLIEMKGISNGQNIK